MGCWLCDKVAKHKERQGDVGYFYVLIPHNPPGVSIAVTTEHEYPDASKRMRMLNAMRTLYGHSSEYIESGPPHFYIEVKEVRCGGSK